MIESHTAARIELSIVLYSDAEYVSGREARMMSDCAQREGDME